MVYPTLERLNLSNLNRSIWNHAGDHAGIVSDQKRTVIDILPVVGVAAEVDRCLPEHVKDELIALYAVEQPPDPYYWLFYTKFSIVDKYLYQGCFIEPSAPRQNHIIPIKQINQIAFGLRCTYQICVTKCEIKKLFILDRYLKFKHNRGTWIFDTCRYTHSLWYIRIQSLINENQPHINPERRDPLNYQQLCEFVRSALAQKRKQYIYISSMGLYFVLAIKPKASDRGSEDQGIKKCLKRKSNTFVNVAKPAPVSDIKKLNYQLSAQLGLMFQ